MADRPQPRLDRETERGYAVTVGRYLSLSLFFIPSYFFFLLFLCLFSVRPCNVLDIKFTLLSHNTVLGAAGSAILNAEVAVEKGLLQ